MRLRQASQGRFLRLRGCLARPNWLWMVNLRGRACWPWANGSAPLSMSCVTRAFHGERVVRRPALPGLAGARVLCRRTVGGDGEKRQTKQTRVARRTQRRSSFSWPDAASRFHCTLVRVGRHVAGNGLWAVCREATLAVASNVTGPGALRLWPGLLACFVRALAHGG